MPISVGGFVLCVRQALMGNQITVYGEGKQTRSFCYVSDLVDGLMRLMNGDYIGPVNLGRTRTIPPIAQTNDVLTPSLSSLLQETRMR